MTTAKKTERYIKKICAEHLPACTRPELDERILGNITPMLRETKIEDSSATQANAWRTIMKSRITKLAAAAVIILAALIGVRLFIGSPEKPTIIEIERKQIEEMVAARDIDSLVTMLSKGQFESKVFAAQRLGDMGDERALPELQRLYLAAKDNLPEGYKENPFAEPIEKIKNRIDPEPGEPMTVPDANETMVMDVTEGPVEAANEPAETDETVVAAVNAPAETEDVLNFFVVHKETREPLEGVELDIKIQREGPDDVNKQVTDEQGLCEIVIGKQETNYVSLQVFKEKFVPLRVWFTKDETGIPKSYTLTLEPGTSVGGFVEDEQGGAIEAATVYLRAYGGRKSEFERVWVRDHEEKTDANGFWQCDIMPAKLEYVSIRLAHPNYIDDESYNARTTPSVKELRGMNSVMVMEKGVDLMGMVVDLKGHPIAKASVKQGTENTWGIKYPRTETDAEGRFGFKNTRPGEVLLTVQAKGYAPEFREIMACEGMGPLEFHLGPAQTIRGRVVDSRDKAIEGVEVELDCWHGRETIRWETKTDAEGFFEWNDAPKDEMKFAFSKKGYRPIRFLDLSPDVDEHIIVMYQALRVSGKVMAADSNEPINEFRLILGTKSGWDRTTARTFTGGRYEVELTWQRGFRGTYVILLEANGYVPGVSRTLTEEEENVVIDFRLEKGRGPSGIVYLANGEPAAGAKVALSTPSRGVVIDNGKLEDDKRWQSVTTAADGRFSFPPQIDRYLSVVVHDEGYAEVTDEELAAEPNVVLEPWGRIEGVLSVGGRSLFHESVHLEYYADYQRYEYVPRVNVYYNAARTDTNGCFAWGRLVPGKVKISHLFSIGGVMATPTRSEIIEVLPGETVNVTIGGSGRAVIGKFVAADPNESITWGDGRVSLDLKLPEPARPNDFNEMIFVERRTWNDYWRDQTEEGREYKKMEWEQGRSYRAKIEPDGTFQVDDVPPGEYELRVSVAEKGGRGAWGPRKPVPPPDCEFIVLDVNERDANEPLDLGVVEIKKRETPNVGDMAVAFEAETFDGQKISLADYGGKVVLLTFWTCERSSIISRLDRIIEGYNIFVANEQFVALGMSLDRDTQAAKKFAKDNELKWLNCFPAPGTRVKVSDDYEIWTFPMTFVIGPDGGILATDPSPLILKSVVEEALGTE